MKTNTLKELYKPGEKKQNETELMLLQCYYQYAVLIIHWWEILWLLGLVLLITDFNSLLEITYTVKTYNEVLGITNGIFHPSKSKKYGKKNLVIVNIFSTALAFHYVEFIWWCGLDPI